ncbi:hypothetical protein K502DRAFT_324030 [Neoconidiobolus thromboides FSU 785]|nr:hypothetical protein K502DRAFT_324030 [Neoconidiobolus thromboides FSU 785]
MRPQDYPTSASDHLTQITTSRTSSRRRESSVDRSSQPEILNNNLQRSNAIVFRFENRDVAGIRIGDRVVFQSLGQGLGDSVRYVPRSNLAQEDEMDNEEEDEEIGDIVTSDEDAIRVEEEEETCSEEEEEEGEEESTDNSEEDDLSEDLSNQSWELGQLNGHEQEILRETLTSFFRNSREDPVQSNPSRTYEKSISSKLRESTTEMILNSIPLSLNNWKCDPLSFLSAGQCFEGTQNHYSNRRDFGDKEHWEVKVVINKFNKYKIINIFIDKAINSVDHNTGAVVGLMEALNTPVTSSTVVTYWEGEVIDFVNYDFWTRKWGADKETDIKHWKKLYAFKELRQAFKDKETCSKILDKYIFMRWKEKCFVNILAQESGLTIAGFYYICIRRSDGFIEGYYHDPTSKPFQRLELLPVSKKSGHLFEEFTFA